MAVPLGIQHGLFQARHQHVEPAVEITVPQDLAHLPQALLDSRVGALDRQAAADQAAPQQVQALLPARLLALLLLQQLQILFPPALLFYGHPACSCLAGRACACSASGRRISTATGR